MDLIHDYPKFPRCGKLDLNFEHHEDHDITDKDVDSTSTKMTAKLHFACISTLLEDALIWYNKNGPNPGLSNKHPEKNQMLWLYL